MTIGLRADFSGAIKKTNVLLNLGKASKYQCTSWTAETIRLLMRSAANMQKSSKYKKKTSMLMRNIGKEIQSGDNRWQIAIGTGIGGKKTVPYALIQDKGGITKPHLIQAKAGKALAFMVGSEMRFLRHVHHPGSNIPASGWFSNVIAKQEPILSAMMQPNVVLTVAEIMASGAVGMRSEIT